MSYDKNIAKLFILNYQESARSAKLLESSYNRIANLIPLSGDALIQLSTDDMDRIDAFRVRFCDLQDSLGSKVFRSLLKLEEETIGSQLDILNKIEKREIVSSFESWKLLRDTRNLFSHDYPEDEERRAEALTIAHKNTPHLLTILSNTKEYVEKVIGLPLNNETK